jgi:NAD(P)H-hydrate epimerase
MDADVGPKDSPAFPVCDADAVTWITVAQMRDVDRVAIELGVTLPRMMENAGAHLAQLALTLLAGETRGRQVTVLVGHGGNGGGGLVAARRLIGWGANLEVRLSDPPAALAPVTREQLDILVAMGAPFAVGADRLTAPDLFLDAVLGYSQHGSPRGGAAALIAAAAGARVISLDVPSGLALEDGSVADSAIRAEATLTLALPKAALRDEVARAVVGELYLADIAIPPAVFERLAIEYRSPFSRGPVVRLVEAPGGNVKQ